MNDPAADISFEAMRHAMVQSQLRPNAVNDPRVVTAMAIVPRENFVPADMRRLAYRDTALPIGNGRYINVPMATGRLLTEAYLLPTDRVLLIGAAGGYTAAVLATLVAEVVAVESDADLVRHARAALADYANVKLVEGPLEKGYAKGAPYDVLIVDGCVEQLPATLTSQVAPGGRIASGIVERGVKRLATGRAIKGAFGLRAFVDMDCVALPGFAAPRGFAF
ncbi:protein-L-isoaspartate O-methyltransferase [Sphingomonas sp.]|jgi:protein-L-isoaspartate(D-aspartate) O-methyltransferase|uniref:protein-L-isoaspartate O-methyltransferase family protein n=1 Tax=Sphingomonas sp. TaxID=28214 RepID=UPI002E30F4BB|nr:protein-L-isoaspartate O-methyltransferase [Sphingomonas sp.]HEX4693408.1 protein-L-isoaspartate O-methyltransferase [Sphingomonas sp.]